MARKPRITTGNTLYHVINRANKKTKIFLNDEDYQIFITVLRLAEKKFKIEILAYCIMPNHWHLLLYTLQDGEISKCMKWITGTHTQRFHLLYGSTGQGHIYQGRYKSFVIGTDQYLAQVFRYIERNPLKAGIVRRAEHWRWSSLFKRLSGKAEAEKISRYLPIELPKNYLDWVNEVEGGLTPLKRTIL